MILLLLLSLLQEVISEPTSILILPICFCVQRIRCLLFRRAMKELCGRYPTFTTAIFGYTHLVWYLLLYGKITRRDGRGSVAAAAMDVVDLSNQHNSVAIRNGESPRTAARRTLMGIGGGHSLQCHNNIVMMTLMLML